MTLMMNRENFEYLVACLSRRTKGKKYENYVINRIWYELADPELKPVTQQYVNRKIGSDGAGLLNYANVANDSEEDPNHAFIDLYFPQLRIGVECDESHHAKQISQDAKRLVDIKRAIPKYQEIRIDVSSGDPVRIEKQISDAVTQIRHRKAATRGFHPWRVDKSDLEIALESRRLKVSDDLLFRHNGDVKKIFGGSQRPSYFSTNLDLNSDWKVWCPTMASLQRGELASTNSMGIINVLIADGDKYMIGEAFPTDESVHQRKRIKELNKKRPKEEKAPLPPFRYPELSENDLAKKQSEDWGSANRIVIPRVKDAIGRKGFQFLGLFSPPARIENYLGIDFFIFNLIKNEVDLNKIPSLADTKQA